MKNGGPVFPENTIPGIHGGPVESGISLRDGIAIVALVAIMVIEGTSRPEYKVSRTGGGEERAKEQFARRAYAFADSMIAEREKEA